MRYSQLNFQTNNDGHPTAPQARKIFVALSLGLLIAATGCSNPAKSGPSSSSGSAAAVTPSDSPVQTRFAGGQSSAINDQTAASSATETGTGFDWSDPNGYRFHISVSFGTPGIAVPVANCAGGDAPPGTVNVPFTMTVTNLLSDRASALPALNQELAGLSPNPHPAGASAFVSETDGTSCGGSPYEIQGREQTSGAIAAGGSITVQSIAYAVPTPMAGAMTFTSLYDSSTAVASMPLPTS